jgi:hypothetical protein
MRARPCIAAAIGLLAGCGCHSGPAPQAGSTVWIAPGGTGHLTLTPFPPQSLNKIDVAVYLHDGGGLPATGDTVTLTATMPSMTMPPTTAGMQAYHNHYVGEIQFSMPGAWKVAVDVAGKHGPVGRHTFDVTVQ